MLRFACAPALVALSLPLCIHPGCASLGDVYEGVEETAADVLLPVPEEVKLGEELSAEVERQATLHPDPQVQQYVRDVGRKIASHADAPDEIDFAFKVIDDDSQVNAFALPGGFIYVYSGLLLTADSEAELASVLAHETAHVTERHVAGRLVAAYGLEKIASIATGKDAGQVGQIVTDLLSQGVLLKYGRDQESEADRVGIETMIDADYDPHAFISLFEEMAAGGGSTPTFLSSHPDPEQRIHDVAERLERRDDLPDFTGADRYRELRRRV